MADSIFKDIISQTTKKVKGNLYIETRDSNYLKQFDVKGWLERSEDTEALKHSPEKKEKDEVTKQIDKLNRRFQDGDYRERFHTNGDQTTSVRPAETCVASALTQALESYARCLQVVRRMGRLD